MSHPEIHLAFDSAARIADLGTSFDLFWMAISGFMVLLMQLGFAFLEGGCVRFKNIQSIMIKVFVNTCIALLAWWFVGYGLAFGTDKNTLIGSDHFMGSGFRNTKHISLFILQASVGAAANSIVSGGACERMSIAGYSLVSLAFSSFIYPICIHWAYGGGWLDNMGYHDFAGSGTIHLTGAVGALVITVFLRPRKNRFDEKYAAEFEPSNVPFIALASLSLWVCWLFFNAGSSLAITGDNAYVIGKAATNTMVSGASGAITVMFIHYYRNKGTNNEFSLVMVCNGNLAGLVAITGSCDGVEKWAAFVIGILGGFFYMFVAKVLYIYEIDDPVDAIPIHGGCGLLGAQFPGIFDTSLGLLYGHGGRQLGVQLLGCLTWFGWSLFWHAIVVVVIKSVGLLSVTEEEKELGIDFSQAGGPAYCYESLPQKGKLKVNVPSQVEEEQEESVTGGRWLFVIGFVLYCLLTIYSGLDKPNFCQLTVILALFASVLTGSFNKTIGRYLMVLQLVAFCQTLFELSNLFNLNIQTWYEVSQSAKMDLLQDIFLSSSFLIALFGLLFQILCFLLIVKMIVTYDPYNDKIEQQSKHNHMVEDSY